MSSFKVRDLPPELLQQLGYNLKPAEEEKSSGTWLKKANTGLSKLRMPQLQHMEQGLRDFGARRPALLAWLSPQRRFMLLGALSLVYLFFCYCSLLICEKAGQPAGVLIWFPVVQLLPLLRAAKMSNWWLLAFLVPVVNVLVQVVWSFKIVQARAKNFWLGLLLLLPGTNLLTFLYLAFSDAAPQKEERVVEIMTLDAA
jgi:apolipoprotein N-acyltransferase